MNDLEYYDGGELTARQDSVVANPFGSPSVPAFGGNTAIAKAVSEKFSEMQARMMIAQQFPRDEAKAMDGILNACRREGLAVKGTYCYARGGQNITGPSIRLAEEILRHWKHVSARWSEVERREDSSVIECSAWDMESNILETRTVVVPHYRTTKKGKTRLTDERDINELLANQASRRLRMCILALIPGDVVEAAVEQCRKTVVVKCNVTPERVQDMLAKFAQIGVTQTQIEKRIQRKVAAIAPAQFVSLGEIYNSINDGMSLASDWFEEDKQEPVVESPHQSQTEALKGALKRTRSLKKAPDAEPALIPASRFESYKAAIENAATRDDLERLGEEISNSELAETETTDLFKLIDATSEKKGL